jgi:hypothetical protein
MTQSIIATVTVLGTVMVVLWLNRQTIKWIEVILNWFPAILFAYALPALVTHSFQIDLQKFICMIYPAIGLSRLRLFW